MNPLVGIIMGSDSDLAVMEAASDVLKQFGVAHEVTPLYLPIVLLCVWSNMHKKPKKED